jgi:hypothetical protein
MGVDYRAFLGYGKTFDDQQEAIDFILERGKIELSEEELEELYNDPQDFFNNEKWQWIELECMNYYRGYPWFVGHSVSVHSGDLSDNAKLAKETFTKVFGEEPQLIHKVIVY